MPEILRDGQTRRVRIWGVGPNGLRLHERFEFVYRPLAGPQRRRIMAAMETAADRGERIVAETVASRVEAWDFTIDGEMLPINEANVSRLEGNYWTALWNVLTGLVPPDEEFVDGQWVRCLETDAQRQERDNPN